VKGAVQTIGLTMILAASAVAALAGWALLAVLRRITRGAQPMWTAVAVIDHPARVQTCVTPWPNSQSRSARSPDVNVLNCRTRSRRCPSSPGSRTHAITVF